MSYTEEVEEEMSENEDHNIEKEEQNDTEKGKAVNVASRPNTAVKSPDCSTDAGNTTCSKFWHFFSGFWNSTDMLKVLVNTK